MENLFDGVKVLDFSNNAAGPVATSMLADFGAEVIKIERPVVGDDARNYSMKLEGTPITFFWLNRGKRSVEIALNDPEGVDILRTIIRDVDVVVESFKPGVMKKFGLDYEHVAALNPNVVYCSVSAFGQTGPNSKKPGYDLLAQGLSGLMDNNGEKNGPPVKVGTILGDYVGALNAFGSIAAALYYRKCTGQGQYIDVSLLDGLVAFNNTVEMTNIGLHPTRNGNHSPTMCPYGVFNGKPGQSMIICAPSDKLWAKLCALMERPEAAEKYDTGMKRAGAQGEVISIIESYLKGFDDISEAVARMEEAGIPCCKVMTTDDLLTDEHLLARGSICDMPMPARYREKGIPTIKARGLWMQFSKTPGQIKPTPDLGEGNHEILERYGVEAAKIDELEAKWADQAR